MIYSSRCYHRLARSALRGLGLAVLLGWLWPQALLADGSDTLVFGIHPYQPDNVLRERFEPLAEHLASNLGMPVEIRIGANYEEHIHAVGTGLVDLAFVGPAGYVNLTEIFGRHRLLGKIVTDGEPVFRGHLVVAEGSPLKSPEDLAGRKLAFVDRYSTMYLIPVAMLKQAGLTQEDLSGQTFLGSHHNVAIGVLAGDFDAGAVKEEVFLQFADDGLRSLASTMAIPEHVFVAAGNLEEGLLAAAQTVLLTLADSADGLEILQSIKPSITGVTGAADTDYDSLRGLLKFLDRGPE